MGAKRIELSSLVLETSFLPLETHPNALGASRTRIVGLEAPCSIRLYYEGMHPNGYAPSPLGCKPRILLLNYGCSVGMTGIEPAIRD